MSHPLNGASEASGEPTMSLLCDRMKHSQTTQSLSPSFALTQTLRFSFIKRYCA